LPQHLGGARILSQEVVGDPVRREVQDAAVGVLFQDLETAVLSGHEALDPSLVGECA
jgi:hypothetical protein